MNAVNMDTGYVNYLSDTEKREVLSLDARRLSGKGFRLWPARILNITPATTS